MFREFNSAPPVDMLCFLVGVLALLGAAMFEVLAAGFAVAGFASAGVSR